jgi:Sulfotransferase family
MHPMGATLSQECVTMMGEAMCTPLFHCQFRVPAFEDWVDRDADWAHVYDFHERQLQHLQWRNHRDRWVLKTGAHMWGLEHLLRTYPDARIVFTHRDPVKSVTSYASLTTLVRSTGSDEVDRLEIAQDWTARLKRVIDHAMSVRNGGPYPNAIFYDMHFSDFVADQFAVVSDIYAALGLPMTDLGAMRMKAFIADNPKGKHGLHLYTPEEYGIDPEVVRRDFRAYIEQYDLAPE